MSKIKLSQWAKENGLSKRGAYVMFQRGELPGASQLPSGTILVDISEPEKIQHKENIVLYSRVSSPKQKDDLDRQEKRLMDFTNANGWIIHKSYKEIASGLNDNRPLLNKLLESKPTKIIIEHKDRLTRFGFNYLKKLCDVIGCEIVIINQSLDNKEDLMTDFVSVITSMTARLYGLRRSKRKTEIIIAELQNDSNN